RPRRAAVAQADDDVDAGVGEVQRVRVPLAAVPEYRHLAGEQLDVAGLDDLCHLVSFPFSLKVSGSGAAARSCRYGRARARRTGAPALRRLPPGRACRPPRT